MKHAWFLEELPDGALQMNKDHILNSRLTSIRLQDHQSEAEIDQLILKAQIRTHSS